MQLIERVLETPALPGHCGGWEFRSLCKISSEHPPDPFNAATQSRAELYRICSIAGLTVMVFFGHEWFLLSRESSSGSLAYTDDNSFLLFIWKCCRNNRWAGKWLSLLSENAVVLTDIVSQCWMYVRSGHLSAGGTASPTILVPAKSSNCHLFFCHTLWKEVRHTPKLCANQWELVAFHNLRKWRNRVLP
jgi:hypothetical protein